MAERSRVCAAAAVILAALTAAHAGAITAQPLPTPRLYVLDCGTLAGRNLRTYGLPPEARGHVGRLRACRRPAASRAAIDALVDRLHAQLWIEHDILGYARLTKAPAYYD